MPTLRSMASIKVRGLRHNHRYPVRGFIVADQGVGVELADLHKSSEPALPTDTDNP